MAKSHGAMHVATVTSRQVDKAGQQREYQSHLVRRTFREDGKVKHQTLANITALPPAAIEAIRAVLRGEQLLPADQALQITGSLPHGHVGVVWAQAKALGLPGLLGPAGQYRDLALALIIARVIHPASKLATASWWDDTTLGVDLGVAGASTDEIYQAMDWLLTRQDAIQATLAKRHLAPEANPSRMALFDLSSSWLEGSHCPLAKRGYSRDGRKGSLQIEYGLLTDPAGCPVAIKVFEGNTADPTAFIDAVATVRDRFNLTELVLVGDRGMITNARISAVRADPGSQLGWLTALRAPAIKTLAAEGGPLQPTLFDQQNLAEISHPDYPGERLIACRNPFLAAERARKRTELLTATENLLAPVLAAVAAGRLAGADRIGLRVGKIINRYKMAKHLQVTITNASLHITRNTSQIAAEAALDGIYVLRTSVSAAQLDAAGVVTAYKNLAKVERDFRSLKVDDLDLRPIYHRLGDRVRAHVLICMLAGYLTWHLRKTLAPLTYTDEHPPARENPVAPASRSTAADRKASRHRDSDNNPVRSFRGLLDHLATLTRNQVRLAGTEHTVTMLAEPTPTQQRAFELLNHPLPLTLK
ncbi:MAG: IS1634 family transposase [Propionibacteriaceae bacterium]